MYIVYPCICMYKREMYVQHVHVCAALMQSHPAMILKPFVSICDVTKEYSWHLSHELFCVHVYLLKISPELVFAC